MICSHEGTDPHHFGRWMKHMAAVPKGFLRYYVLRLLNEEPMSGSEIMAKIQERTNGHWKPSPGSIYPLLAWLQDKGLSKETPQREPGMKRYTLTAQGRALLEEHEEHRRTFRRRMELFRPPFPSPHWFNHHPQKAAALVRAGTRLVRASWKLLDHLSEKYSKEAVARAEGTLEQAAQRIEEITASLKDETHEHREE